MFCLHLGFLPDDINKIYKFESKKFCRLSDNSFCLKYGIKKSYQITTNHNFKWCKTVNSKECTPSGYVVK